MSPSIAVGFSLLIIDFQMKSRFSATNRSKMWLKPKYAQHRHRQLKLTAIDALQRVSEGLTVSQKTSLAKPSQC